MVDSDPVKLYSYLLQQCDARGIAFVEIRGPESTVYNNDSDKIPHGA